MKIKASVNKRFAHLFVKEPEARFYVEKGGAGSGKSYSIGQAIIQSCMANGARRWLCTRKVRTTIRHSVFDLFIHLLHEMNLEGLYRANRSDLTIEFVTGAVIICVGLDDVSKLKSIHGITDVWMEEADECTSSDFRQLNLRLRGGNQRKRMILSFNPTSALSWIKQEFFDNPKANAIVHESTYRDNAFIDDEYRAELRALKDVDQYFYQVYTLGHWGVLGNRVFHNFVVEDFRYGEEDFDGVSQGMDFGFNHASAIIRVGWKDGELWAFDELYAKGLTNAQLIDAAMGPEGVIPETFSGTVIADSAEPDRIREFNESMAQRKMRGGVVGAKKGKDSVRMGIDFLKRYRIHVHASRCPNLAREIANYKWREDKDGNILEEPVPFADDTIAALRYAVEDQWATAQRFTVLKSSDERRREKREQMEREGAQK
jgi:phage terminase large subunit